MTGREGLSTACFISNLSVVPFAEEVLDFSGVIRTMDTGWHVEMLDRAHFGEPPQMVGLCARVQHLVLSHTQPSKDSSGRRPDVRR